MKLIQAKVNPSNIWIPCSSINIFLRISISWFLSLHVLVWIFDFSGSLMQTFLLFYFISSFVNPHFQFLKYRWEDHDQIVPVGVDSTFLLKLLMHVLQVYNTLLLSFYLKYIVCQWACFFYCCHILCLWFYILFCVFMLVWYWYCYCYIFWEIQSTFFLQLH